MNILALGSANVLDLQLLPGADRSVADIMDPVAVKEKIGLGEVSAKLFPFLKAGVRFWPYILVARDLDSKSVQVINATLKRIKRSQPKNRQYIGPGTSSSFRNYQSMYRDIERRHDTELRRFIFDSRHVFTGNFAYFARHRKTWQRMLLAALGPSERAFAKFLRSESSRKLDTNNEEIGLHVVERAISRVLESAETPADLWHGAACYAFLRCMYGVLDAKKIVAPIKAADWAKQLLDALEGSRRPEAQNFRFYKAQILLAKAKPPWAKRYKSLHDKERRVFADLRFHTFANVYLKPSPRGY